MMSSCVFTLADINMEKGQFDIPFLSPKKIDPSLLLIYIVLYHTSTNNVHTRSRITSMGNMLCPNSHVHTEHFTIPEIFPFLDALPTV